MRATAVAALLLAAGIVALAPYGLAEIDFRRAERLFASRAFEKGLTACDAALRWEPAHAGARALRAKLQLALSSPTYRRGNGSADGLMLDVLDRTNELGFRLLEAFELEEAEGQFGLVMKLVGLAPSMAGIKAREDTARGGLERIAAMLEDR